MERTFASISPHTLGIFLQTTNISEWMDKEFNMSVLRLTADGEKESRYDWDIMVWDQISGKMVKLN